jgi:hypothetical protein
MEIKEAILDFQYSEKLKSGLIVGAGLLNLLSGLKGDELAGGKKVFVGYLGALLQELQIAGNVMGPDRYRTLEAKISELTERVEQSRFEEAMHAFSEAISLATTSCQRSMSFLAESKLI